MGWLEKGHEFTEGPTVSGFLEKLVELAKDPFQPIIRLGGHACPICDDHTDWPGHAVERVLETDLRLGVSNLFVPVPG